MEGRETSPPKSIKLISDILIFTGCTRCSEAHVDVCTVHVAANHRQTVFFFKKMVSVFVYFIQRVDMFLCSCQLFRSRFKNKTRKLRPYMTNLKNKLPMRLTMRID
uniref:Uncharacterized protein n=1 Tax=Daphnia magna TaxID=35525 RepID=A0A0P6B801_9CRUS